MKLAANDERRQEESDSPEHLVGERGQRLRDRQRFERKDDALDQIRVRDNRIGRELQGFLKSSPGQQPAEKIERVIPGRAALAKPCAKDSREDKRKDRYHHDGRQHGPSNAQHGTLVARRQLAPRKRRNQIKTP